MGTDYCPKCNALLDSCSDFEEERTPLPGDLTVCISCTGVLRFGKDMALEAVDESDDGPLAKEPPEVQETIMKYKLAIALSHAKVAASNR